MNMATLEELRQPEIRQRMMEQIRQDASKPEQSIHLNEGIKSNKELLAILAKGAEVSVDYKRLMNELDLYE
ncbi:MAG: hypothetical protein HQL55_20395 [Magnetococcales bacterium]|nr:hypothetical protein [Magnetococcales bacterium]